MNYYLMKLRLKLNPTTIWIPKYSAAKLHLISLKNKILIPVAVIVIIVIGIAIFSSNLFYNPDSISITITDISGTSDEKAVIITMSMLFLIIFHQILRVTS